MERKDIVYIERNPMLCERLAGKNWDIIRKTETANFKIFYL